MNGRFVDITGMKFGRLQVLEFSHVADDKLARWICKCDCGNSFIAKGSALRKGNTKSCGCYKKDRITESNKKDMTGVRFGKLVIIRDVGRKYGKVLWECLCDCGNTIVAPAGDIRSGKYVSCGCRMLDEGNPRWRGGTSRGFGLYSKEWGKKLRRLVRELDSHKCQFYGCECSDLIFGNMKLSVHHIDGNKKNCELYNLISLCGSHHQLVEAHNPKSFCEYFYGITGNRNG